MSNKRDRNGMPINSGFFVMRPAFPPTTSKPSKTEAFCTQCGKSKNVDGRYKSCHDCMLAKQCEVRNII